jgi:hypothetical protein
MNNSRIPVALILLGSLLLTPATAWCHSHSGLAFGLGLLGVMVSVTTAEYLTFPTTDIHQVTDSRHGPVSGRAMVTATPR